VWVYKKTAEEKFPTLKKYSDKAPPSDKFASHEVKVDYEYKSVVEPDKVVPPDQRIKGYLYGPQVVPVSTAEWEAVKFKPEKGVKLLGFTDRSNVPRYALTFSWVSESLKGGPSASGRVLPPVTGRSRVRAVVSSHCTGEDKACH